MIHRLKFAALAAVPVALLLTATPAAAQLNNVTQAQKARTPTQTGSASEAPPPALPGAASAPGAATPSDRPVADMSPNDALFDAINRGDIADARDAINRGADLSARNVLGMTPIDLSIDLSRNNITFLMLSLRGAPTGGSGSKSANAGTTGKPGAAHPGKTPTAATSRAPKPNVADSQAPPKRQQFVSSDPGHPVPQAGFLGFGGTTQQ